MIKIQGDREQIENLPAHAVSDIGLNQVAYIKPITESDREVYAVHAADGTQISVLDDMETAEELIRYNNLQPVTVH